ncbi:hypothetical protein DFH07DRAFT_793215 [Mycena maculata]|uniref:F-box domain-containing protein n=1 Tax=Mycena maculata TaxID=230809 RepID=A0AAD7K8T0_9AGAR|nr:hypothetical protein DFH07DRAFT_793215 [Mycena maculata]
MSLVDSPFADRLETNYVPSDSELEQLRTLLEDPTDELARFDAQIVEMEAALAALIGKRASLKTKIDAHRALMSPIRRAPLDILQDIFFACLPTAHNALMDPGEAPMKLGRVCRHWRSVAYSTPILWSSLHIPSLSFPRSWDTSDVRPELEIKLEEIAHSWLDRSAACPLSISLSRAPYHTESSPLTPPTVGRITQYSARLRHLGLCVHISEMQPLLLLAADDLPCLESVHIQCPAHDRFPLEFWNQLPIFQVSTIRAVSLHVRADALALPLRWAQLTDLNLACFYEWGVSGQVTQGGLDQNGAQELLHRCPSLVRCRLRATRHTFFIAGPTTTLPHLETLILADDFEHVAFMKCLVLPKLRYLGIGGNHLGFSSAPADTSTITVDIDCIPSQDILELLALIPSASCIRVLNLQDHGDGAPNDEFLAHISSELTHLELGVCSFSDSAILEFIQMRMIIGNPLCRFAATFARAMHVDILQEIQSWVADGLEVDLQYDWLTTPKREFDARAGLLEVGPP